MGQYGRPNLALAGILVKFGTPTGTIAFEFCGDLWQQKTRIPGLSQGMVCVNQWLADQWLAVLVNTYLQQTNGETVAAIDLNIVIS